MSGDDLDAPLGFPPDGQASSLALPRDIPWAGLALGGMGLIAVSLVAFVVVTEDRTGGLPQALTIAPIDHQMTARRISAPALAAAPTSARDDETTSSIGRTVRAGAPQVEIESGVKVVRRGGGDMPDALIIRVPDELRTSLAPAPDPRLIAPGPYGVLPRIGRDGSRPADIYARPVVLPATIRANAPRIALVVTGMGLNEAMTEGAVEKLPPAVTLAFAPYGERLEQQAEQARAAGHELLLQTPMEGFASNEGAGARMLPANAPRDKLVDMLHWHMGRFPGYIGLTNFLGGRFMSSQAALATLMQDVADRGLVFLDDGSSPQSLALPIAVSLGAGAARADVMIEASQRPEAVEALLRRLEALARESGHAVGIASGAPQSVDRVARFAQGLDARGIALVPLSALIAAPARTSAR